MNKIANLWMISEVANGFIIAKDVSAGYNSSPEETFVFNSATELADWIRRNLNNTEDHKED